MWIIASLPSAEAVGIAEGIVWATEFWIGAAVLVWFIAWVLSRGKSHG